MKNGSVDKSSFSHSIKALNVDNLVDNVDDTLLIHILAIVYKVVCRGF